MTHRHTMKYLTVLTMLSLLLGACKKEPMIQISEENQAKIDAKLQGAKENKDKQDENSGQGDTEKAQDKENSKSMDSKEDQVKLSDLKKDWKQAKGDSQYDFDLYMPYQENTIKTFLEDQEETVTYVTYASDDHSQIQVEERSQGVNTRIIQRSQGQYVESYHSQAVNPYVNRLNDALSLDSQSSQVLLAAPIEKGTSWQVKESGETAEITALYDTALIDGQTYQNVVEVQSKSGQQVVYTYYGQDVGLLGRWRGSDSKQAGHWLEIKNYSPEVMLVHDITMDLPKDDQGGSLLQKPVPFAWQTNYSLGKAFQEIWRQEGLIDETVEVISISVDASGLGIVDFTPGVVAVLNQYPASEEAIIQSLVQSVGHFLQVEEVRLTVNGNGLLPNSGNYPDGGVYPVTPRDE